MTWTLNIIIPFVTFFLYLGLLILVILARPQTEVRRRFRWFLMTMTLWSLSAFFTLVDAGHTTLWMRILSASATTMLISLHFFVETIIERTSRLSSFVIFYTLVSIVVFLFTNLLISNAEIVSSTVQIDWGPVRYILLPPAYLLAIYNIVRLVINYRASEDVVQRNRLLYLIIAISLIILISPINFTPLGKYALDIAFNGISALIIAYAILRYQLLDIRVVIRQGLVYSIPTIIIGTTYFLVITLSLNIFNVYSGGGIFLLSLVVAILSALVAEPLRNQAQAFIDRLFFREKYNSTQMLQTLSGSVATVLDTYKITSMILDEVCGTLHIPMAAFFLRDENTNRFQLTTQVGQEAAAKIEFRQGHPLVLWLSSHEGPLTRHDLEVLPQFQSLWRSERQDLENLQAELFIPIRVQDLLVGIFVVGSKRSEQAYTLEDILTLTTVANQTAVAIENARLYTSEQTRLQEMDTLYSMARRLVTSDNLNDVVATVAEHAVGSIQARYARLLIREENGDYLCRAHFSSGRDRLAVVRAEKEQLIAEHYYNWILQGGRPVVIHQNDPDLHREEKMVLFHDEVETICLSPLKGVDDFIGLLILGDTPENQGEVFTSSQLRLVNVISDYAASAIQRAFLHDRLEENFLQTIVALANAMDARDSYTGDHSQRMADIATTIARKMHLTEVEIEDLRWASILHDIGKIGVPDQILNKPGPLNKEDWVIMKEHPVIGAQIVEPVKYLSSVSPIIRAHHERFDGTGYPYGLEGEDIPLGARILTVVDAYVAIRDERVYSKARTHEEAIAELRRCSGSQFDPYIVDIFCKTITE